MKINSINSVSVNYNHNNSEIKSNKTVLYTQKPDLFQKNSISFGNYYPLISDISAREIVNIKQLSNAFIELIDVISNHTAINKTDSFYLIKNLMKNHGLQGLLMELREPDTKSVQTLIDNAREKYLPLAKYDGKEIFTIYNSGAHGFFESLNNVKTKNQNVSLQFFGQKDCMREFAMDGKGRLTTTGATPYQSVYTEFHPTGNRSKSVRQPYGFQPDSTYYNKDGSEAFFKNWFFGGTPVAF